MTLIESAVKEENHEILDYLLTVDVKRIALEKMAIAYNRTNVLTYLSEKHGQYDPSGKESEILFRSALEAESLEPLKHLIESGRITMPHHISLYYHQKKHLAYLESLGYKSYYEYGLWQLDRYPSGVLSRLHKIS